MDRRSFITTLIGGFAAASLGGIAAATAAPSASQLVPIPEADDARLAAGATEALDGADAGYSQYYYRRRPYYRRGYGYGYGRRGYGYGYGRRRYYRRPDRRSRPNSQR
jgi:hypothetical protein